MSELCFSVLYSSFFFFKQKTAYEMRISDWSSDVCSSDLDAAVALLAHDLPDRLGADRRAHQMHVDHKPEILDLHIGETSVEPDARIVHQDVDPAPFGGHALDHRRDLIAVGDRRRDRDRLPARAPDLTGERSEEQTCDPQQLR